jgi:hypothetical protein
MPYWPLLEKDRASPRPPGGPRPPTRWFCRDRSDSFATAAASAYCKLALDDCDGIRAGVPLLGFRQSSWDLCLDPSNSISTSADQPHPCHKVSQSHSTKGRIKDLPLA